MKDTKLISDFMESNINMYIECYDDANLLLNVIEKINTIDLDFDFCLNLGTNQNSYLNVRSNTLDNYSTLYWQGKKEEKDLLDLMYEMVVTFIKWYNSQNTQDK